MNEQKVNELIQRYFDGATSLDEERELQRYFERGDMPDALKIYSPLFRFFAEERAIEPEARIQKFGDSKIQKFKNSKIQRFKGR